MKRAAFHNLGCKVNAYETDVMKELLFKNGYTEVPFEEEADVYIINTCTVTNIADRKSRQMIRRAKNLNPEAVVVAVGCYTQVNSEKGMPEGADIVIGNDMKGKVADILSGKLGLEKKYVKDLSRPEEYEDMQLTTINGHTRAYIKVQDGCNQFCSYCLIPYARGRVRSRRPEEVCEEIKKLTAKGVKEFVIDGIHLSAYGTDFDAKGKIIPADTFGRDRLYELLKSIDDIEGVERIRLGSVEPRLMDEDFVKKIAGLKKLCPHFHLSLQSGSDTVLDRMNRHYDTGEFFECTERLRRYFDDPALTTDIITGFPGETEEEFEETYSFAGKVSFYEMHIFRYSKRDGTPAATMKGQILNAVKEERSRRLEKLGRDLKDIYRSSFIGKEVEILFENEKESGGKCYMQGFIPEYVMIAVEMPDDMTEKDLAGQIYKAKVTGVLDDERLLAQLIN